MDVGIPTDDEVTIPSHDRIKEVPDFPAIDIRDEQTLLNTQREDWLLPTEPLHGARPRQTGRERPPVIENRLPMEATGGAASRKPGCPPPPPVVAGTADFDGRGSNHTAEGGLRVHHVGYEQYLILFLMISRMKVYGMVVWIVRRILDRRSIC